MLKNLNKQAFFFAPSKASQSAWSLKWKSALYEFNVSSVVAARDELSAPLVKYSSESDLRQPPLVLRLFIIIVIKVKHN